MAVEMIVDRLNQLNEVLGDERKNPSQRRANPIREIEADLAHFNLIKSQLFKRFEDKYIAVCRRTPVLAGDSFMEVAKEFCKQYGSLPFYIGLVSNEEEVEVISQVA